MLSQNRLLPALFLIISLIALIAIAGALSQVSFRPTALQPIQFAFSLFPDRGGARSPLPPLLNLIQDILVVLSIAVLPIAVLYVIISKEAKTRVLRYFLLLMLNTALFIILLPRIRPAELEPLDLPPVADQAGSQENFFLQVASLEIPDVILYSLIFLVISTLLLITWFLVNRLHKRRMIRSELAEQARDAIQQIQSGRRFDDIIVRCYYEMCRTLNTQFGVERKFATTPREFEHQCLKLGLPEWAVTTLTRLFEEFRYGQIATDQQDQDQALACLRAISDYAR
jgi:hypothetical protein